MRFVGTWLVLIMACGDDSSTMDVGVADGGSDVAADVPVDVPPDVPAEDARLFDASPDVSPDAGPPQMVTVRAVGGASADDVISGLQVFAGVDEATMIATTDDAGEATVEVAPGGSITIEFVGAEQTTYTSLVSFDENVPQDDGVFIMPMLVPEEDLDMVTLSGSVTGADPGTAAYVVTAAVERARTTTMTNSPDFSITLPRQPGDVAIHMGTGLAVDDPRPSPRGFDRAIGAGAVIMVDATMDQSDLVIDVTADGMPLRDVSGTFSVPEGDAFLGSAPANIQLRSAAVGGAIVGGVERIFFDEAANLFRWDGAILPIDGVVASIGLQQNPLVSIVNLETDGSGDLGELPFLQPPNIASPAFGETVSPGEDIVVDNTPPDTYLSLILINGELTQWWVLSGNESTVTIPPLPAGSTVLTGDNVRFRPRYCTRQDGPLCPEFSFGRSVDAAP